MDGCFWELKNGWFPTTHFRCYVHIIIVLIMIKYIFLLLQYFCNTAGIKLVLRQQEVCARFMNLKKVHTVELGYNDHGYSEHIRF